MNKWTQVTLSMLLSGGVQAAASASDFNPRYHQGFQDYTITDGMGDGVKVHHGLFGIGKQTVVQDRLGDKYVNEHGVFSSTQGVNFLGNGYVKHKGLIGGPKMQASDMFGDSIQSRHAFLGLGRKQTNVNLSGVSSIAQQFIGSRFGGGSMMMQQPPIDRQFPNLVPQSTSTPDAAAAAGGAPIPPFSAPP